VQRNAGYALKKLGYDRSQFLPDLAGMLDSESDEVRARGARGLGLTQEPRPDLVKKLRKLVKDRSPRVRAAASCALFHWTEGDATALDVLRKLWSSADESVSNLAFEGLLIAAWRGEKTAVRGLLKALEHDDAKKRRQAAKALAKLANKTVLPVDPLARALQDESEGVRIAAALALAMSKANAKSAVPALIVALTDPEPAVVRNAALALVNMGKDALPGLRDYVEDNDPRLRAYIVAILGDMDEAYEEAIRVLEEFADDELPSLRKLAQEAIRTLRKKMAARAADGGSGGD
jgi:HEAT repeat protein